MDEWIWETPGWPGYALELPWMRPQRSSNPQPRAMVMRTNPDVNKKRPPAPKKVAKKIADTVVASAIVK
jgi:hypothetical protein